MADLGDFFAEVSAAEQQALFETSVPNFELIPTSLQPTHKSAKRGREGCDDLAAEAPHKRTSVISDATLLHNTIPKQKGYHIESTENDQIPPPPPPLPSHEVSTTSTVVASGSKTASLPYHLQLVTDTPLPIVSANTTQSLFDSAISNAQPSAWVTVSSSAENDGKTGITNKKRKMIHRVTAGQHWIDNTLEEWPENDYRIFVGDLDPETQTETLAACFSHYTSFAMAKIIKQKHGPKAGKGKGYGFVSFIDPMECAKAIREQQGKLCGGRPMKIMKSTWKDRDRHEVQKKEVKKQKMLASLGLA